MRIHRIRVIENTRLGYRGVFLLGLAILDVFYGVSIAFPDGPTSHTPAYMWREQIMPNWAWGAIWIAVGLALILNAFRKQDRIGYGLAVAIKLGWAFISAVSWLTGAVHNGWVSMVIWGIFGWVTLVESLRGEPVHTREVTYIDPEGV